MVSHPGIDAGGWGGVLSLAAQCAGVAGTIVDGSTRDVDEAIALGYPIFARVTTSRTARGRVHETATNAPITVDGVTVHPGNFSQPTDRASSSFLQIASKKSSLPPSGSPPRNS